MIETCNTWQSIPFIEDFITKSLVINLHNLCKLKNERISQIGRDYLKSQGYEKGETITISEPRRFK